MKTSHPAAAPAAPSAQGRFGAFGGVFTPSVLTILGVIMFMRANYVVGRAGVFWALATLMLCKSITLLTSLSIAGISTNTRIRGGGAYFMISRVLGPEFGGAIGLALYFAQTLSAPFYVLGFTEAVTRTFPALEPHFMGIGMVTATLLFLLTWIGAQWAVRAQYVILTILGLSILAFILGLATSFEGARFAENWTSAPEYSFWVIFALYFPAVTGIMAGVNMSGDLKDPARSIPRGTFAAILVGFLVYAAQMALAGGAAPRETLEAEPFELLLRQAIFGTGFLVSAGVFAATLSSAIGSLMGAPRVLQALARDNIFEPLRFFGAGAGVHGEPRRPLILTFAVTLVTLLLSGSGEGGRALNAVAVIVTMFFLYTYGMTNLAAFVESFGLNPSFRPRFRYFHWATALAGTVGCAGAAVLISPFAALGAAVVVAGLYFYVRSRVLVTTFGDARRGFVFARVRNNLLKLQSLPEHAKNWRPTVLAFSGNPRTRPGLIKYGNWVEGGRGIVTLAEIMVGEFEKLKALRKGEIERLTRTIQEQSLGAFPEVLVAPTLDQGIMAMLQAHSLSPIKPNLALFGWTERPDRLEGFQRNLRTAYNLGISVLVLKLGSERPAKPRSRIDIWWRGMENGSLMLILAHLMQQNWEWARARIRILRVIQSEEGIEPATGALSELVRETRMDAQVGVICSEQPFREVIYEQSRDADLVLLGFRIPEDHEAPVFTEEFAKNLERLPDTLLVCSTGTADATE